MLKKFSFDFSLFFIFTFFFFLESVCLTQEGLKQGLHTYILHTFISHSFIYIYEVSFNLQISLPPVCPPPPAHPSAIYFLKKLDHLSNRVSICLVVVDCIPVISCEIFFCPLHFLQIGSWIQKHDPSQASLFGNNISQIQYKRHIWLFLFLQS